MLVFLCNDYPQTGLKTDFWQKENLGNVDFPRFFNVDILRLLAPDLNPVKSAISHRLAIFGVDRNADETETTELGEENIWGEGVKIVQRCIPARKPFSPAEKDEFVEKYNAGMSMGAIARECGCNHVTVRRILRRMGVEIRL